MSISLPPFMALSSPLLSTLKSRHVHFFVSLPPTLDPRKGGVEREDTSSCMGREHIRGDKHDESRLCHYSIWQKKVKCVYVLPFCVYSNLSMTIISCLNFSLSLLTCKEAEECKFSLEIDSQIPKVDESYQLVGLVDLIWFPYFLYF